MLLLCSVAPKISMVETGPFNIESWPKTGFLNLCMK
jgi:hypothetical protein